jgi:hypothetical protein
MTGVPHRSQRRSGLRAPVHRHLFAVREAPLEELEEEPLVPAVVLGVAGDYLGVEVEHGAHLPELAAHMLDVGHRPLVRMNTPVYGGILGREPEGVEAYREEDPISPHPHEARPRVRGRHGVPVPDVQIPARVREHRERVVLGLVGIFVRLVQTALGPALLPAALDGYGIVISFRRRLAHERLLRVKGWGGSRPGKARRTL